MEIKMANSPCYDIKEAITETTGTVGDFTYPAHTYYLANNGKCLGFKSCMSGKTKWFTKTMTFSKARRTFAKADIPEVK